MQRSLRLLVALLICTGIALDAQAECNTAPVAVNDVTTTLGKVQVDVLVNDSDAEFQALNVTVDSTTCSGTVTVDFDLVTLDPEPRLYSDCSIDYSIADESGSSDSATIQVTMRADIFIDGFESGDALAWGT